MTRKFHQIQSCYWDSARTRVNALTSDEMLVELFLITCPQCRPSGVFNMAPSTIGYYTGLTEDQGEAQADLWGKGRIEKILEGLQSKSRVNPYPGGWLWVIGKWEFEGRSEQLKKSVIYDLEAAPVNLAIAFLERYQVTLKGMVTPTLKRRLQPSSSDPHGDPMLTNDNENDRDNENDTKDLPASKPAAGNGKVPAEKKTRKPIEERNAKTPNEKVAKYWHVTYLEKHAAKYSGNIVKMKGQIANLLKRNTMEDICCAIAYLLNYQEHDKYHKHEFDHFVRKVNTYIIEAKEAGYEYGT